MLVASSLTVTSASGLTSEVIGESYDVDPQEPVEFPQLNVGEEYTLEVVGGDSMTFTAEDPEVVLSQPEISTYASWISCGSKDSNQKIVRGFQRVAGDGLAAGATKLRCGSSAWGYRHININHKKNYQGIAVQVGENSWTRFADFSINQALRYPATVNYRSSNDTYAYRTEIQIRDSRGKVIYSFYSLVAVARVSKNIISAYPQR